VGEWNSEIVTILNKAVPWLRPLVAGLSTQNPKFDSGAVNSGFEADTAAMGQVFSHEFFGFPLSVSFHRGFIYSVGTIATLVATVQIHNLTPYI
jgi:hypothetical protein